MSSTDTAGGSNIEVSLATEPHDGPPGQDVCTGGAGLVANIVPHPSSVDATFEILLHVGGRDSFLIAGASDTLWNGITSPFAPNRPLPFVSPSCRLLASVDIAVPVSPSGSIASLTLVVPEQTDLADVGSSVPGRQIELATSGPTGKGTVLIGDRRSHRARKRRAGGAEPPAPRNVRRTAGGAPRWRGTGGGRDRPRVRPSPRAAIVPGVNTLRIVALSALLTVPSVVAQVPQARPDRPVAPQGADAPQKPVDEKAEIEKLINDGLAAWRAGNEQKAADLLQTAVARIQARAARNLASFLPTKAAGWTFGEPDVNSGSWGSGTEAVQWSTAEVTATRESDEKTVHVQLTNSPQIYQGMQVMVTAQAQMAALLKQQGIDIASSTKDGFTVLTMVDSDNANAWIVGKRIAVMITIDGGNRAMLDTAVGWIDTAGLSKIDVQ
ncbi:MAG: hypothetical protein IPM29_23545 [Planctomycetes bacterium]|nr:hypothetical protein [Planctomycetota bacterium]